MPIRFQTLDKLPLFASEEAIAAAVLGPRKLVQWRQIAPLLEARGFPTVSQQMGGRYTPAVRAFFDRKYKVHGESQVRAPHEPANLGAYARSRNARKERK